MFAHDRKHAPAAWCATVVVFQIQSNDTSGAQKMLCCDRRNALCSAQLDPCHQWLIAFVFIRIFE